MLDTNFPIGLFAKPPERDGMKKLFDVDEKQMTANPLSIT